MKSASFDADSSSFSLTRYEKDNKDDFNYLSYFKYE
jgi:hypothetical protein